MYELYIGNKNYSSWSLRPWVLMRALAIPFVEHVVTFRSGHELGEVPCVLAERQGAVPGRRHDRGLGFHGHRRVPRGAPCGRLAAWIRSRAPGHAARPRKCTRASRRCARSLLHELRPAREARRDLARPAARPRSHRRAVVGGPAPLRRARSSQARAFTAVDAFYCPVAFRVRTHGLALSDGAAAYARRLLALPAMREWYDAALAEPWREAEHEVGRAAGRYAPRGPAPGAMTQSADDRAPRAARTLRLVAREHRPGPGPGPGVLRPRAGRPGRAGVDLPGRGALRRLRVDLGTGRRGRLDRLAAGPAGTPARGLGRRRCSPATRCCSTSMPAPTTCSATTSTAGCGRSSRPRASPTRSTSTGRSGSRPARSSSAFASRCTDSSAGASRACARSARGRSGRGCAWVALAIALRAPGRREERSTPAPTCCTSARSRRWRGSCRSTRASRSGARHASGSACASTSTASAGLGGKLLLNYPLERPRVRPDGPRPNVLIIAVESLRADMLSPEVMPFTWEFSRGARRFVDHASGGSASRYGTFTLVYGLHGSYFAPVYAERASPVLVDELKDLGYEMRIYGTSPMTFPEMRSTAWVHVRDCVEDGLEPAPGESRDAELVRRFTRWVRTRATGPAVLRLRVPRRAALPLPGGRRPRTVQALCAEPRPRRALEPGGEQRSAR